MGADLLKREGKSGNTPTARGYVSGIFIRGGGSEKLRSPKNWDSEALRGLDLVRTKVKALCNNRKSKRIFPGVKVVKSRWRKGGKGSKRRKWEKTKRRTSIEKTI